MSNQEKVAALIEAGRLARTAWRKYNEARNSAKGIYNPEQYSILSTLTKVNPEVEVYSHHVGFLVLEFPKEVYGHSVYVTFLDSGEIVCGNLTLKLSHNPSHLDVSGNIVDRAYAQKIYDIFIKFMETSVFMLD